MPEAVRGGKRAKKRGNREGFFALRAHGRVVRYAPAVAGCALRHRFSPGYGDLPLSVQPAFLAALDATRRLGITLTSSFLMVPTKSVTAFVGVARPSPGGS